MIVTVAARSAPRRPADQELAVIENLAGIGCVIEEATEVTTVIHIEFWVDAMECDVLNQSYVSDL